MGEREGGMTEERKEKERMEEERREEKGGRGKAKGKGVES